MPTPMTPRASERSPDTIVLVHGFWVTPRSWEHWIPYYEAKGYRVLAPAYPGFEIEGEALHPHDHVDDPDEIGRLLAPCSLQQLRAARLADHPARLGPVERGNAGRDVVEHLHEHATQAERDRRTEQLVV